MTAVPRTSKAVPAWDSPEASNLPMPERRTSITAQWVRSVAITMSVVEMDALMQLLSELDEVQFTPGQRDVIHGIRDAYESLVD